MPNTNTVAPDPIDTRALRHVFGRDRRSPQVNDLSKHHHDNSHHEPPAPPGNYPDRKSTRLNSSHSQISYAVFCLKKKKKIILKLARFCGYFGSSNSSSVHMSFYVNYSQHAFMLDYTQS